jgi:hypothetical protein
MNGMRSGSEISCGCQSIDRCGAPPNVTLAVKCHTPDITDYVTEQCRASAQIGGGR